LENNLSSEATVTGINLNAKQSSSDEGTNKSFAVTSNLKSSQLISRESKTYFPQSVSDLKQFMYNLSVRALLYIIINIPVCLHKLSR
jgi:hypothetical protein